MLRKIRTEHLKIGMYVILPTSWLSHPFLKNEFLIKSDDQIRKLLDSGLIHVEIDSARSSAPEGSEGALPPSATWGRFMWISVSLTSRAS